MVQLVEQQGHASDGAEWLRRVEKLTLRALDELGEATATELSNVVPDLKLKVAMGVGKTWGTGISTRVLFLLATEGRIVRARPKGSWISSQYRWATIERWTGWGRGDTRAALDVVGAVEVELETGADPGYLLPDDLTPDRAPKAWVAFLPALDPTVMDWKQRDWYLDRHAPQLFDRNGNAGPTVWASGQVVGGWAQRSDGTVAVEMLADATRPLATMIDREAQALTEWLAGTRVTPRFRTPIEKALSTR